MWSLNFAAGVTSLFLYYCSLDVTAADPTLPPIVLTHYLGGIYAKNAHYVELLTKNRAEYCRRYGYLCVTPNLNWEQIFGAKVSLVGSISHLIHPTAWVTLTLILDLFNRRVADQVLWIDADALITNFNMSIPAIWSLSPTPKPFVISADKPAVHRPHDMNRGIFLVRRDDVIIEWFQKAMSYSKADMFRFGGFYDQMCLQDVYNENATVRERVHVHEPYSDLQIFTITEHPNGHQFLIHGAGDGDKRLDKIMAIYKQTNPELADRRGRAQ